MSDKIARIAVIEDTASQRLLLARVLADSYDIVEFGSGEDFLVASPEVDVALLDIEMPGISGYETCRRMGTLDSYADTPVIFVSGHDSPEDRVEAYEAGGDHFVTKPIVVSELLHKIELVLSHRNALRDLRSQSSLAQQVAFSAMSGMGDLGVIIEFQRKAATCRDYDTLAEYVVDALKGWELRGMVQIRGTGDEVNRSSDAAISPLQASIMSTMRNMGRIFEMKSRAVVNYGHVSILVHNLPTEDPDRVGRLRDNLTLLTEGANICVMNMDTSNARRRQIHDLGSAIAKMRNLMQNAAVRDSDNRAAIQKRISETLDGLARAVDTLGLTPIQEEYISHMVYESLDELNVAFDEASAIQLDFTEILLTLQSLSDNPTTAS